MSVTADQLADLLHDALAERFPTSTPTPPPVLDGTGAGNGTGPAPDGAGTGGVADTAAGGTALLFATVGRPVDRTGLRPPEGTPPASAARWVEQATSEIVDPLPGPGTSFLQGTRRLSREYDAMVRSAGPRRDGPPDVVAMVEARIARARKLLDDASIVPIAGPPVPFLPTTADPVDWFDPAGTHWTHLELSEHTPAPQPPPSQIKVRPKWKWLVAAEATRTWLDLRPFDVELPAQVEREPVGPRRPRVEREVDVDDAVRRTQVRDHRTQDRVRDHRTRERMVFDASQVRALRETVALPENRTRFSQLLVDSAAVAAVQPAEERATFVTADVAHARLREVAVADLHRRPTVESPPIIVDRHITDVIASEPTVLLPALVEESQPQPATGDGFSLELDYCWVRLDRVWLDSVLLSTPGWQVPGYAPGAYSAGDLDAPAQAVPGIPIGFVVVKDVVITANWSSADADLRASSAALGPFLLADSEYVTGSATLRIPGMQIIAWMVEVPPVLPPGEAPTG